MESKFHIYIRRFLFLRSNYESESNLRMKMGEKYYIKYYDCKYFDSML